MILYRGGSRSALVFCHAAVAVRWEHATMPKHVHLPVRKVVQLLVQKGLCGSCAL
jgi:hypothetical protein